MTLPPHPEILRECPRGCLCWKNRNGKVMASRDEQIKCGCAYIDIQGNFRRFDE